MLKQFQAFVMRGNIIDLAVGVIIGGAFQKIIDALVSKLIMPIIGIFLGGINFEKEAIKIGEAELGWGAVVQEIFNFVIIGFVLFMILKAYNTASKKQDASYAPEPTPTESLLADIKKLMQSIDAKTGN
jgi:large conductance mechanosensitive channel